MSALSLQILPYFVCVSSIGSGEPMWMNRLLLVFKQQVLYLIIIFAGQAVNMIVNSLDPDQASQDVGPDLDPNCFSTLKDLF